MNWSVPAPASTTSAARWPDVEHYPLLKTLHVTCAVLSGAGFTLRGFWMWTGHRWHGRPATRTLPHLVDTLLLGSAVAMVWSAGLSPLAQPWLAAKIVALIAYVVLGAIALRGAARSRRGLALVGALAVYAYIVAVATSHSPTLGLT